MENEHWNELLIGRPTLKQYNLLPEQNFRVTNLGNNNNNNNNNYMGNRRRQNQNQNQHGINNPLAQFLVPANNNNNAQSWKIGSVKDPLLREPDEGMGSNEMVKVKQESKKLLTNVEDETAEVKDEQNVTNNTFVLPKELILMMKRTSI